MADEDLAGYLKKHPALDGLEPSQLALIAGLASVTHYKAGQRLFEQDGDAKEFFIVREGRVTIEVPAIDGESLKIQTVGDGSLLGWSWLIPPYRWSFDARAQTPTTAITVDGEKLREACEADPKLGYEMMKRFALLMAERLNAARLAAIHHYSGA